MDWVRGIALALGGPGLFIIALLDSSFLSFPELVDVLIVVMSIERPELMIYYVAMSTLGSVAGCFALFMVARKGGEAFLRKRFSPRHVDRAIAMFQKYGLVAVAVPAVLPPPVPFKLFVLAAGVAGVRPFEFIVAVGFGRGLRYLGEGLLAVWYGEAALAFLHDHATSVTIALAMAMLVFGVGWVIWHRRSTG